ncbi:MAG: hypothetical protein AAF512_01385 [Pseudomonadota bacterium]
MYICIDIETCNASNDAIEREAAFLKAPSNIKDPTKIEAALEAKRTDLQQRSALKCDASPIACIGVVWPEEGFILHHLPIEFSTAGKRSDSERDMLKQFGAWLNDLDAAPVFNESGFEIVGFNVNGFDLPRLRYAYVRHGLKLPRILTPRAENVSIYDVQYMFGKYFMCRNGAEHDVSLDECAVRLGLIEIEDGEWKHGISGADVPGIIDEGDPEKMADVLSYCLIDTTITARAYLAMTSQTGD